MISEGLYNEIPQSLIMRVLTGPWNCVGHEICLDLSFELFSKCYLEKIDARS